jgi:hypothetical protein
MTSIDQSSLRTLNASGQTLASFICSLSHVALSNYIELLHLPYYNRPIHIHLSALHCITLLDIVYCLNYCSSFPTTIHSISILLFCFFLLIMCFQTGQWFCIHFQLYHNWVHYVYLCMTYQKLSMIEAVKWLHREHLCFPILIFAFERNIAHRVILTSNLYLTVIQHLSNNYVIVYFCCLLTNNAMIIHWKWCPRTRGCAFNSEINLTELFAIMITLIEYFFVQISLIFIVINLFIIAVMKLIVFEQF